MPSTINADNGIFNENKPSRDEIAMENVEKLHRMVLGKDMVTNDNEYVENFYVDMAKGVSTK